MEEVEKCVEKFNHKFQSYNSVTMNMFQIYAARWRSNLTKYKTTITVGPETYEEKQKRLKEQYNWVYGVKS